MKATIQLLILSILLFTYNSCGKECTDYTNPQCSNYDPCRVIPKTSADFYTEVRVGDTWVQSEKGKSFNDLWRFRAKDTTANEYRWTVGADVFTTKSFTLSGFPLDKKVPITLSIKRYSPNTKCYPDDKGTDVVTHNILSLNYLDFQYDTKNNLPPKNTLIKTLNGKYWGCNRRDPTNKFKVEIQFIKFREVSSKGVYGQYADFLLPDINISNIPYPNIGDLLSNFMYKEGYFQHVSSINGSQGTIIGNKSDMRFDESFKDSVPMSRYYNHFSFRATVSYPSYDTITIPYQYIDTITRLMKSDVFVGVRIP